jgi:hypothetical protein
LNAEREVHDDRGRFRWMPDNVRVFLTICLLVALLQAAARGFRCFQLSAMKLQEDSQLGFFGIGARSARRSMEDQAAADKGGLGGWMSVLGVAWRPVSGTSDNTYYVN